VRDISWAKGGDARKILERKGTIDLVGENEGDKDFVRKIVAPRTLA